MSIYQNIQEIAQDRGMSLKEVAKKAGIGENSIYRWQNHKPSMSSLNKVAIALNVDVEDLTTVEDSETPEYRAIQRKAKKMTNQDQKKLLNIMKAAFGDK
ncbi:helix-turn-helix domain-containing protein [Lactobacillus johnsonii]|uniref:Helix-turn-helix domain-containing protein n=1 Tax=Lactobacillus johnsonii TaxID=33959 RepID=A0A9X7Y6I1_LACJH|nr:helix-turn-helix transcriptional regulator [Lactobacillus johnsonii]QLL68654.1 helix-turn-helix domain-containing protein [Lactobacillus johnsonii]